MPDCPNLLHLFFLIFPLIFHLKTFSVILDKSASPLKMPYGGDTAPLRRSESRHGVKTDGRNINYDHSNGKNWDKIT